MTKRHRMTILYTTPADPAAFRRYYYDNHIPIARQMKGLTGWTLSWVQPSPDSDSQYLLVAELYAQSSDDMDRILASPEGKAASADLENFVTAGVEFLRGDEEEVEFE